MLGLVMSCFFGKKIINALTFDLDLTTHSTYNQTSLFRTPWDQENDFEISR